MKPKYQIRYQHTASATAGSLAGAKRDVRSRAGIRRLHIADAPDGIYCYRSKEAKARDETGARAYAVICGPKQQGDQ